MLEGLKGRPIDELCAEHEISQTQYYQWREMFLAERGTSVRAGRRPQRRDRQPNQWWGTDMTKVMIDGFGRVYLVVVLDWHTTPVCSQGFCGSQPTPRR